MGRIPTHESAFTPAMEQQLDGIRARKNLSLIPVAMEGTAVGKLPEKVYGFTGSGAGELSPLFARRIYQGFELHKLSGGAIEVIGFLPEKDAVAVNAGESVDVNLYPEPYEEATHLVEIPLARIRRARPLSRAKGNYMPLELNGG
ncbi:MAG: hypothetical protein R2762_18610 [Bryobacteraceae bacterium]